MKNYLITITQLIFAILLLMSSQVLIAQQQESSGSEPDESEQPVETVEKPQPNSNNTIEKIFRPSEDISEDAPVPFPVDI